MPAVRFAGLRKTFPTDRVVLDDVDLQVCRREILALLGENGAGKSTLMEVLAGLVRPDAGSLALGGETVDWARYGPAEAHAHGVGMVHQHSTLVPAMTVPENLSFGPGTRGLLFRSAEARDRVAILAALWARRCRGSRPQGSLYDRGRAARRPRWSVTMAHGRRFSPQTLLLALVALAAGPTGAADDPRVVRVTGFGAEPGSRRNAVAAVARALEACRRVENPVLVFPKGRYDFWPQHAVERDYFESNTTDVNPKRLAILIEGFAGLTVDGGGSTFVFHDRMQPFTVDGSTGVTIRDLSIDWDVPLSAEAVVETAAEDHLDLRIDDRQFPHVIEDGKLVFVGEGWKSAWWDAMEFDGRTLEVVPGTGDAGCLGKGWREHRASPTRKLLSLLCTA